MPLYPVSPMPEDTGVRVQSIESMTLEEIFVANVEHSREEVEA